MCEVDERARRTLKVDHVKDYRIKKEEVLDYPSQPLAFESLQGIWTTQTRATVVLLTSMCALSMHDSVLEVLDCVRGMQPVDIARKN